MNRTSLVLFLILSLNLLSVSHNTFAQSEFLDSGCLSCTSVGFLLVPIFILGVHIAILIWVAKDAKARGIDEVVLWLIAVFLMGIAGLVIYLILRPKGTLLNCPHCERQRLRSSTRCPHCGRE